MIIVGANDGEIVMHCAFETETMSIDQARLLVRAIEDACEIAHYQVNARRQFSRNVQTGGER
jgi:hypothetical protein